MKNIDIRNLAGIGVADVDVYKTNKRKFSSDSPKLLMFFRSKDQADNGLPKEDTKSPQYKYPFEGRSILKYPILDDLKYDQSFGFDLFRENLIGNNTAVYKINEDKNGDYLLVKDSSGKDTDLFSESNTGKNIETYFDKTALSLELNDGKRNYFIDTDFKLKKGNTTLKDKSYYAPNILIKPDKEVKLIAKFFDTDNSSNLGVTITFIPSNSKGIESYTNTLTFNQNMQSIEFKIKTKANETIDVKTSITAFIKDSSGADLEIGRITLLPNSLYQPKLIFVDTYYKKNTTSNSNNYTSLTNDLNNKAFNQAALNFGFGKKQIINLTNTDHSIKDPSNNIGNWLSQKAGTPDYETAQVKDISGNPIDTLGKTLSIVASKFFESLTTQLLKEIEISLQNFDINDGITTRKLLPSNKTFNDWFIQYSQTPTGSASSLKWYNILVENLYDYVDSIPLAIYPIFMCHNIYSSNDDLAKGFTRSKGLIIPANGMSNVMIIAHELGHNLGLRHTFDRINHEKGDIKIKPFDTLENIMDYLPDTPGTHNKNFITFQIERIRENSARLKYNIDDMNFTIGKGKKYTQDSVIKDFTENESLEQFCKNICYYLFNSYSGIYNLQDENKLFSHRDKILMTIIDVIKVFFKNI